jgi:acyl carrier protein
MEVSPFRRCEESEGIMPDQNAIMAATKSFILSEFLEGEDPDELTEDVELISSGILDSLATLKLVTHLENTYDIKIEAHEADEDNLNTLVDIAKLVASKL